jgi:hypothetical protein
MRSLILLAAAAALCLCILGCVQPRYGSPDYYDPYGNTARTPEKRWWAEEKGSSDLDIDKFLWRWRGLTE